MPHPTRVCHINRIGDVLLRACPKKSLCSRFEILRYAQNDNPLPSGLRPPPPRQRVEELCSSANGKQKNHTLSPNRGLASRPHRIWGQYNKHFQIIPHLPKKLRPASEGRCRYATGKIGYAAIGRTHRSAPTVHAVGFADTACSVPTVDDKTNHSARCGAE